ncbi:O-Glycosyl hydrolase [Zunongwangia mangrovi]|uniref:O-Glycosyl hydrolase n=1 Tax=Zunongwangia mangrovi TaxID=1334022 RepID=A0A1I1MQL7_9FLAO|nr:O-Glycosyl hydrolase [Zunongwangia mangrovi]
MGAYVLLFLDKCLGTLSFNNYHSLNTTSNLYTKAFRFVIFTILLTFNCFSQSIEISIDPTKKFQDIDGFGASDAWRTQFVGKNWPDKKKQQIADWLFSKEIDKNGNPKGIGLSIWRFYISAGSTEQGEASGIKNEWRRGESFIDESGNYDWNKQQGQQWFLNEAKDAGVDKFLAFSIAAPYFWSKNDKAYAPLTGGSINLQPNYFDEYSRFLVEIIDHFEQEGIHFDYLSPINEPQWEWEKGSQEGTPAKNNEISDLVAMLDKDLRSKDLSTSIIPGEAADLRYLYSRFEKPDRDNQIEAFFSKDKKEPETYIRDLHSVEPIISGHSYFTTWPVDSLITIRRKLNNKLQKNDLEYWQSEFCILENSDDIGGGSKRDLGINTALYVARVIHADLTLANARSWQWWTALTIADFKDGLIYLDTGDPKNMYDQESLKYDGEFHDSKLLWALGNYSRFVTPRMQRISAVSNSALPEEEQFKDLMVSAYYDATNNKSVVVLINYSEEEKNIDLKSTNLNLDSAYETSEASDLGYRAINKNQVKLAPKSITTLTGKFH